MEQQENIFENLVGSFKKALNKLPGLVGKEALHFIADNFAKQGFMGETFQPWKRRKSPTKWGTKPKRTGRNLLVLDGHLRPGWRVQEKTLEQVTLANHVPYAKAHNEGFRGSVHQAVGSFTRKQTYAGVAGKFKVNGVEVITGAAMSIKSKKNLKPRKVQAPTFVTGFNRKIQQNIPQRKMIGNSPYLTARVSRVVAAELIKALKNNS